MFKSLTLIAIIALTCVFIYFDGAFVLEESKEPIQVNQEYQKNADLFRQEYFNNSMQ